MSEFGQPTGPGSKKYREAVKAKCKMVTPEELLVMTGKGIGFDDFDHGRDDDEVEEVALEGGAEQPEILTFTSTKTASGGDVKKTAVKGKKAVKKEEVIEEVPTEEEPKAKRAKRGSVKEEVVKVKDDNKRVTRGDKK